jgi:4-hydroxybenzoate polyprenyltransferase
MSASPSALWATGGAILRLLRWHKPAGRLILMIPALWGAFLAGRGTPPWPLVGIIILGSLAASGAGCVINDLWDRDLDPLVERTRHRPLASRELTVGVGILMAVVSLACAAGLALFLNPVSFALCVAAVPVILLYPGAKRVFPVPQLVLALAWGFAVLISWTAVSGQDANTPLWEEGLGWLWLATVLWTLGFDTVYALADREDDERAGIHSSARFFRAADADGGRAIFFGHCHRAVGGRPQPTVAWSLFCQLGHRHCPLGPANLAAPPKECLSHLVPGHLRPKCGARVYSAGGDDRRVPAGLRDPLASRMARCLSEERLAPQPTLGLPLWEGIPTNLRTGRNRPRAMGKR